MLVPPAETALIVSRVLQLAAGLCADLLRLFVQVAPFPFHLIVVVHYRTAHKTANANIAHSAKSGAERMYSANSCISVRPRALFDVSARYWRV